jgi:hypothetical protein
MLKLSISLFLCLKAPTNIKQRKSNNEHRKSPYLPIATLFRIASITWVEV